jgi:hypothetical protein
VVDQPMLVQQVHLGKVTQAVLARLAEIMAQAAVAVQERLELMEHQRLAVTAVLVRLTR